MKGEATIDLKRLAPAIAFLCIGVGLGYGIIAAEETQAYCSYPASLKMDEADLNTLIAVSMEASNPCGFGGTVIPYFLFKTDNNIPIYGVGCAGGRLNG
jgi:hypothetical protein